MKRRKESRNLLGGLFILLVWAPLLFSGELFSGESFAGESISDESKETTVYLVRHAEKELNAGKDPALTDQGKYRAERLAEVFNHIELEAVYSTDTTRTRDTARPVAKSKNLEVILYDHREFDFDEFVSSHIGKSVLIVGHSNTVPGFANGLLGKEKYQDLDEAEYNLLFVVDIVGSARVAKILYLETLLPETGGDKKMPQHEKINYLEYSAADIEATKTFFTQVFGWSFVDYGPDYTAFSDQGVDGGFFRGDLSSSTEQGAALTVFYSDELEATLAKVSAAGGVVVKPIFSFPGGRRFHFTEPSGNEFAVWGE